MSDINTDTITQCSNYSCPLEHMCKRREFTHRSMDNTLFALYKPFRGKCEHYVPLKKEDKK